MNIPTKLKDIKLETFLRYTTYLESLTEEKKEDLVEVMKNKIRIFFNITEDKYNSLPYTTIIEMNTIIDNLLQMRQDLIPTFTLNGTEYGIEPNFDDITFGEMVDCDGDDVVKQITILYRPIKEKKGKKYIIEEYKADLEMYESFKKDLTLDVYLGFITFFLRIQSALLSYTLKSIKEMAINQEQKKSLDKYGDGIVGSMRWQMGI